MQVWKSVNAWNARRRAIIGRSVGFVPTMGALHRGHASLVQLSRRKNELTVVSIFVNPSQFNNTIDLERYPRTLDADLAMLDKLGVDDAFVPDAAQLYPHGYRFRVDADGVLDGMEAAYRPGHFQGVMTIVLKLLNLVGASRAYFGEKDYQQYKVLSDMAEEFFIPTEIVACPTVRAASGLAESSRNALLSDAGREKAAILFRALTIATSVEQVKQLLVAKGFTVEYVEERWERRFAAVVLDGIRLIDNVPLTEANVTLP